MVDNAKDEISKVKIRIRYFSCAKQTYHNVILTIEMAVLFFKKYDHTGNVLLFLQKVRKIFSLAVKLCAVKNSDILVPRVPVDGYSVQGSL